MFERYTERARRVLFFARYEASQLGSVSIETDHLLLGLIREGKGVTSRIFAMAHLSLEQIRKEIEDRSVFHEKVHVSVEIPFTDEMKRVLLAAQAEADRLQHRDIATEHLLLGILHEAQSVAGAMLIGKGLRLDAVRRDVVRLVNEAAAAEQQRMNVSVHVRDATPRPIRVVVVMPRPHDAIEERLLSGARHALTEADIDDSKVTVVQVPGISEIPMAVQCAAETARFDVAICLCSIVQPMVPPVEITLAAVVHALQTAAAETGVPFTLGVLTAESVTEASGGPIEGPAKKGYETARAALEMVTVVRTLRDADSSGPEPS